MKTIITRALCVIAALAMTTAYAWDPDKDKDKERHEKAMAAKAEMLEKDPNMQRFYDSAVAYVIIPTVGKGGIGIGGAHGKGIVIQGDKTVADTSLSQVTVGFQLGGQVYSQFIMFKDKTAFDQFARGNFEMGAQASAVAVTAGASADADYDKGVAVFTIAEGGLMYEASIGGQKFKYNAR